MVDIRLEDMTVRFNHKNVLKDINISVADGEFYVLVGPSGCGKTLVLRMIAGLTNPTQGSVYISDQLVNSVPPGDRDIAMIFQRLALYPYMTVRENWTFPLKAAGLSRAEVEARIEPMVEALEMGPLMERYPKELSGGQRQRAAIGRALVRRPRIFLMDEPLGSQDAKKRIAMRAMLKELQGDLGITTVYVTHDQIEAQAIGDKIAVMKEGTVQQVGSPGEIYDEPANLFVAGFFGTPPMNFLDCTLDREAGELYLFHSLFRVAVPPAEVGSVEAKASSEEVILGLRPEYIKLNEAPTDGSIPAEVYTVEPQSNELIVGLKVGQEILRMRGDRGDMGFEPQLNQRVFMTFDTGLIHVFDEPTGRRII